MGRRQKQLKPTKVFQDEDAEDGQTSAPTCSNFATRAESPSRNPTRNNRETTTTTKADFEKKISNFSISAHLKESSKNDGSQEKDPVSKDLLSKWAISQFSSPVQQVFPSQLYPYLASADAYNPFYPGLGMDTLPSAASYETFFKGMDSEAQRNYFASMLHLLPTSSTSANSFPQDAQQSHLLQRHGYANGNKEHLHKKKKHQSTPSASRNLTTNSNTANSVKARSGLGRASGSSTGQGQRQKGMLTIYVIAIDRFLLFCRSLAEHALRRLGSEHEGWGTQARVFRKWRWEGKRYTQESFRASVK